jgi:hypothetical protein
MEICPAIPVFLFILNLVNIRQEFNDHFFNLTERLFLFFTRILLEVNYYKIAAKMQGTLSSCKISAWMILLPAKASLTI